MSLKFCPKCGKTETKSDSLINGLCQTCFSKDNPLLQNYRGLKIVICPACSSYLYKNKWRPSLSPELEINIKKIIGELLPEKLNFSLGSKITSIEVHPDFSKTLRKKPGNLEVEVVLKGLINKTKTKETYILPVQLEFSQCNLCKRRNSSYFEATIQIRPKNEKLLNFVRTDIKSNEKVFITDFEETRYGYDLNITSKKYINSLLQKVKKYFSVESKITRTLYGRKEGQDVYRITLLIRLKNDT